MRPPIAAYICSFALHPFVDTVEKAMHSDRLYSDLSSPCIHSCYPSVLCVEEAVVCDDGLVTPWTGRGVMLDIRSLSYVLVFTARSCGILVSIVVSIPACHAGDRGSIPRRGDFFFSEYFHLQYLGVSPCNIVCFSQENVCIDMFYLLSTFYLQ